MTSDDVEPALFLECDQALLKQQPEALFNYKKQQLQADVAQRRDRRIELSRAQVQEEEHASL